MAPWKLPLIVLAIVVPIVVGIMLAGPEAGLALGALGSVVLVYIAVQMRPRDGIGDSPDPALRRRVLVVVGRPVEDSEATAAIATEAGVDGERDLAEVMILAPVRIGFLDRWASDLEPARREAQKTLVISVASLAKVGVVAEARVGDEDIVQAVEDQVGSFPATEVVLVTGPDEADPAAAHAADELASRLRTGFRRIVVA
ncbi:MAG TPA: hypothetical protein VHZ54_18060 [Solirubrobacterales bacterium]|nr:hypothetical protein [Solirubrobacterales bacterium]